MRSMPSFMQRTATATSEPGRAHHVGGLDGLLFWRRTLGCKLCGEERTPAVMCNKL